MNQNKIKNMKVKPVLVAGVLVVVSLGAITFLKNAQFQEEKRVASMAIAKDRAACQLKGIAENNAKIDEYLAEKNPEYKASYEEKKRLAGEAENSCKKVSEFEIKYGSP